MADFIRTTTDGETEMEKRNVLRLSNEESNQLTRECIQTALIKLLADKPLEKITISEVVKRAGVSRTAFYSNYATKEDVLVAVSEVRLHALNALARKAMREQNPDIFYRELFNQILQSPADFSILLKARVQERSFDDVRAFLLREYPNAGSDVHYMLLGWVGMLLNVVIAWFTDGMKESVDEMVELCVSLSRAIKTRVSGMIRNTNEQDIRWPLINSRTDSAVSFPTCVSCKFFDYPPGNPQNLQGRLSKNSLTVSALELIIVYLRSEIA